LEKLGKAMKPSVCASESQGHRAEDTKIRFFKIALKEDIAAMKKAIVPASLTPDKMEIILDNCFYTMAKQMGAVYAHYLLLFPSHQVIIGRLSFKKKLKDLHIKVNVSFYRIGCVRYRKRHKKCIV
jgi:hypothetical protein